MQITSAALLISIALVVFGIAYYYFTTRHKERMAIIESGQSPDLFKRPGQWLLFLLAFGIVSIGVALGIAGGLFLQTTLELPDFWLMSVCILGGLGMSLVACYFILKSQFHKEQD